MLGVIAAVYLLLALRIHIGAEAAVRGTEASLSLNVGALGLRLHVDGELRREAKGLALRIGQGNAPLRLSRPTKAQTQHMRRLWPYALAAIRAGRFEGLALQVRLGLGDAAQTALAAGALRALLSALLAALGGGLPCMLRIVPDFKGTGLEAHGQGVFLFQAGDVMAAVMRAALKRARKEDMERENGAQR